MSKKNMMNEMELILFSGDAKGKSINAIKKASQFNFQEALSLLEESKIDLNKAHQISVDAVIKEARGEALDTTILMIHAQNHLTQALIFQELAFELINIYRMIDELKKKGGELER